MSSNKKFDITNEIDINKEFDLSNTDDKLSKDVEKMLNISTKAANQLMDIHNTIKNETDSTEESQNRY